MSSSTSIDDRSDWFHWQVLVEDACRWPFTQYSSIVLGTTTPPGMSPFDCSTYTNLRIVKALGCCSTWPKTIFAKSVVNFFFCGASLYFR